MKNWLNDLRYLSGYSIAIVSCFALTFPQYFAFGTAIYAFVLIPLFEHFIPFTDKNLSEMEESNATKKSRYDYFLWLSVPIQWGIVLYFLMLVSQNSYSVLQLIGMTSAVGVCSGVLGINVAHELGHRSNKLEQFFSQILLLSSLYLHFYVEHNHGHHRYVATTKDPATARLNENVYQFLLRSMRDGYVSAWRIQTGILNKQHVSFFSLQNTMLLFQIAQILLIVFIFIIFGVKASLLFIASAFIGIILLEIINYIEHYGLLRKEVKSGVYEKVQPWHSWNSDHVFGRIILFELTRHSDHHYKASRKYQVLRHFEESPQLPSGYPAMMLLSLIPSMWFRIMNPRVQAVQTPSRKTSREDA